MFCLCVFVVAVIMRDKKIYKTYISCHRKKKLIRNEKKNPFSISLVDSFGFTSVHLKKNKSIDFLLMLLKKKISTEEEEPKTYSIRIRRAQLHRDHSTSFCQAATPSPHSWCDWFGLHWYRETDDALQMIWQ